MQLCHQLWKHLVPSSADQLDQVQALVSPVVTGIRTIHVYSCNLPSPSQNCLPGEVALLPLVPPSSKCNIWYHYENLRISGMQQPYASQSGTCLAG